MISLATVFELGRKLSAAADLFAVDVDLMRTGQPANVQDDRLAKQVAFVFAKECGVRLEPGSIPGVAREALFARNGNSFPFGAVSFRAAQAKNATTSVMVYLVMSRSS